MQIVSAFITELNRIAVVTDTTVTGTIMPDVRVTRAKEPQTVAGVAMHGDGRGFDVFLTRELELGADITVCLGDVCKQATPDYRLYDTQAFEAKYFYGGALGAEVNGTTTVFRLWSPAASCVTLLLFERPDAPPYLSMPLARGEKGVYAASVEQNLHNTLYLYEVTVRGRTARCVDPYARAAIANARMGVVVDLSQTNPAGWESDAHVLPQCPTDAVLYEAHVRDFTVSPDSGVRHKGKFLGFAEQGTVSPEGEKTGLAHLRELGITHVHLMPVMEYATVDETRVDGYNWGYDPFSYFMPDGSYCTQPDDGPLRVRELKYFVGALHASGIGVVLDVVYNHTYSVEHSPLELVMPEYYYRRSDGCLSNGSGCGNELASERGMARRLMTDSLLYWVNEYHIDGFRFDLMGVHDITTMNYIRHRLDEVDCRLIIYGEGWQGGPSALPQDEAAIKQNAQRLDDRIALFNDDLRDALKGSAFHGEEKGYLGGALDAGHYAGFTEQIKAGLVGATWHPHVMYRDGHRPFAKRPTQTVTYNSSHDNYTLFDKLALANPELDEPMRIRMNKLAAVVTLTAQGISFLHSGEELLRQKIRPNGSFEHNSYNSPDSVNRIRWERKHRYREVFDYYRGLIELRRAHKALRMTTAEDTARFIRFLYTQPENRLCCRIAAQEAGDRARRIVLLINPTSTPFDCRFVSDYERDARGYFVYVDEQRAGDRPLYPVQGETITVPPVCAMVLMKE